MGYQDEFDQPANQYAVSVRFFAGGIGATNEATETFTNNTALSGYPNAWLRLKRVGQKFYVFRGTNANNWISMGSFTFPTQEVNGNPVPPFSNSAYVGPNYSPENGMIPESSGARRAFLAQFREYGEATGSIPTEDFSLTITLAGTQVEISWPGSGTLQTTTNLANPVWTDLSQSFPVRLAANKAAQFFRVKIP